jgi:hypothetical protein
MIDASVMNDETPFSRTAVAAFLSALGHALYTNIPQSAEDGASRDRIRESLDCCVDLLKDPSQNLSPAHLAEVRELRAFLLNVLDLPAMRILDPYEGSG